MTLAVWSVEFDADARKSFAALGMPVQQRIAKFVAERLAKTNVPEKLGKALSGRLAGYWRFRVGDYRLIGRLEKNRFVILIVAVAHRSVVYR